ncbi:Vacuolar protein sorting-associated protein 70 [Candida viswanathii]|uniref:Peptide hydrolase n=1 Tax=Candida viswanathii TaxID=5486 RepID=A0A367XT07_9ASCO|nr:Vacuolar protein sorting-associated protein 70 [Candida viswanathii]
MSAAANTESGENTRLLANNSNEVHNSYTSTSNDTADSDVTQSQDDPNQPQEYLVTPPTTQETTDLLSPDRDRRHEHGDDDADDDNVSKILQIAKRPSFIWVCCLGVVALIIFQLTFLPRTSVARDYRNWHGIKLTKNDIKRNFLTMTRIGKYQNTLTTEGYINNLLRNFTELNEKSEFNLVAHDNPKLTEFVESSFKLFKAFKTESFTRKVKLSAPESSSIRLRDKFDDVVYEPALLEPKTKTPAYFALGVSGKVVGDYVFVNTGEPKDYDLLKKNGVHVKDKIVILKTNYHDKNTTIGERIAIAEYHGAKGALTYNDWNREEDGDIPDRELPALNNAISRDTLLNHTKIPAVPVSKKIIKPILETLLTPAAAFGGWDYAPASNGLFKLELNTEFSSQEEPRNFTTIVGTIKGIINDADIIIGARRDSYTSSNPLSGHAIMLEIMRYYQKLVKIGWKPLRNIKFVSWDAAYLNLLGVESITNDTNVFNPKRTIVAYINIDGDAVTGSKFKVDANAVFNHVLRYTSKSIPIPKTSVGGISDPIFYNEMTRGSDDYYTTLYEYWWKQDKTAINNNLGLPIATSETSIFQKHLATPIINVKFENDPEVDHAVYIPHSNYYSYDWLIEENIDDDLLLHGLLMRFVGLLAISLTEHEVYDYKTNPYFKSISSFYKKLVDAERDKLAAWDDEIVPNYLIYKSTLFQHLDTDEPVQFKFVLDRVGFMINRQIVNQSRIFDEWNVQVEEGLMQDYAWYRYYKKIQHYAEYKVSNYKLAYLENDLQLNDRDYLYLKVDENGASTIEVPDYYDNSIIFGDHEFHPDVKQEYFDRRKLSGCFTYLYESIERGDFEFTIKWLVLIYEKVNNIDYKMT